MSRLVSLLVTAVLAGAGLVAATGAPAQADCDVYTGCIDTKLALSATPKVRAGKKAKVCYAVVARGGEGRPSGTVETTVKGPGGYSRTLADAYSGGKDCFPLKLAKAGTYKLTAKYTPAPNTPWNSSKDTDTIKVKSKK